MTQSVRRLAEAPKRFDPTWVEGLAVAAIASAVVVLRGQGALAPDVAAPMAPWLLDALGGGVDVVGP